MLPIQTPDNEFHDGVPGSELGTILSAAWLSAVQAEINALSKALGMPLTANNNDLMKAILSRVGSAGGLSFRNLLINAAGTIKQRPYVSGAATTAANQYTLDRWRVVVSGQNLSWVVNGSVMLMTAPVGGVEQVIEGENIHGGTYVLNWVGTATAKINGVDVLKGGSFALPANTNATLKFVGGTFSMPQIELGTVPTAFELRPQQAELALAQRYAEKVGFYLRVDNGNGNAICNFGGLARCCVVKRAPPACSFTDTSSVGLTGVPTIPLSDIYGAQVLAQQSAASANVQHTVAGYVFFDSEL